MPTKPTRNMGEHVEILRCGVGHDVAVLRPPHDTPRSQSQATDDYKPDVSLNEVTEQLIEERRAQRARRAASRNSNSLRVSKIVSSRFTTSGRCPSARSRSRRTRSPSKSRDCCFDCSAIDPNTTALWPKLAGDERHARRPPARIWRHGLRGTTLEPDPAWQRISELHAQRFANDVEASLGGFD
jgi:hypothetical protein